MGTIKLTYKKVNEYLKVGASDKHWYRDEKIRLQQLLPGEDINLVIDILCATSMVASMKSNVAMFIKAMHQLKNNLDFEGYITNVIFQLERIRRGEGIGGKKIKHFADALKGDPNAVVVDMWMTRMFFNEEKKRWWSQRMRYYDRSPTDAEYEAIVKYIRRKSKKLGLEPREMSSILWAGARKSNGWSKEPTRYSIVLQSKIVRSLFPIDGGIEYTPKLIYIN